MDDIETVIANDLLLRKVSPTIFRSISVLNLIGISISFEIGGNRTLWCVYHKLLLWY